MHASAAVVSDDKDMNDIKFLNAVGDDGLDFLANVLTTKSVSEEERKPCEAANQKDEPG